MMIIIINIIKPMSSGDGRAGTIERATRALCSNSSVAEEPAMAYSDSWQPVPRPTHTVR